jgi:DNA-binding NarL/FixJ family response regulator
MNPVRLIIASEKKLIAQGIKNMLKKEPNNEIIATAANKEYLAELLQTGVADALIIDQQMLEELYVWKNLHPKMLKRSLKVLLITSNKYNNPINELPGFLPNEITYWEKGMDELIKSFNNALENHQKFKSTPVYQFNKIVFNNSLN